MTIPLVNLRAQYSSIQQEIDEAVGRVLAAGVFVKGRECTEFEEEFAAYCEARHCAGVGNGTDALHLALRALGIGKGDEVITVSHTFMATTEAIVMSGAAPVLVDIDSKTLLLDPDRVRAAITPRTAAIIPVHLYGLMCDMTAICRIAREHGLAVVEDAAQAHGARWNGRRAGSYGDAACFSFYPGKNLGAYGDGGAIVSNDRQVIERARMLSNHGRVAKYEHKLIGMNSRLDEVQASVLRIKLRHLDDWNALRRQWAAAYRSQLPAEVASTLPEAPPEAEPVWHLLVIRVPDRDSIADALSARGVSTGIHYPLPVHRQPAFLGIIPDELSLPVTEEAVGQILSLPMYPELDGDGVSAVAEAVRICLKTRSGP